MLVWHPLWRLALYSYSDIQMWIWVIQIEYCEYSDWILWIFRSEYEWFIGEYSLYIWIYSDNDISIRSKLVLFLIDEDSLFHLYYIHIQIDSYSDSYYLYLQNVGWTLRLHTCVVKSNIIFQFSSVFLLPVTKRNSFDQLSTPKERAALETIRARVIKHRTYIQGT